MKQISTRHKGPLVWVAAGLLSLAAPGMAAAQSQPAAGSPYLPETLTGIGDSMGRALAMFDLCGWEKGDLESQMTKSLKALNLTKIQRDAWEAGLTGGKAPITDMAAKNAKRAKERTCSDSQRRDSEKSARDMLKILGGGYG